MISEVQYVAISNGYTAVKCVELVEGHTNRTVRAGRLLEDRAKRYIIFWHAISKDRHGGQVQFLHNDEAHLTFMPRCLKSKSTTIEFICCHASYIQNSGILNRLRKICRHMMALLSCLQMHVEATRSLIHILLTVQKQASTSKHLYVDQLQATALGSSQ
jgi:hypothetical protein